ncbi:Transmembrane protein 41A [Linnemannia exigua]|uniref:Transmembrane protein 41A n=1 Tax=Linnemannia exigua TaxID=604196 RepID=A0AAD4H9Q3_9FUNG|nr:Transmembrane protein 41A [Linnemannia exigua]
MSILASAVSTTATASALGRFHTTTKSDSFSRQRSSSFNKPSSPYLQPAAGTGFRKASLTRVDSLRKEQGSQRDLSAPLCAPLSFSSSQSIIEGSSSSSLNSNKAHHQFGEDYLDRNNFAQASSSSTTNSINSTSATGQSWLNLPSPTDINGDAQGEQAQQENAPTICTGRSRSSTLTNTGTAPAEVAAAAISIQFDHIMRPRRPSLVNRPSGSISHVSPAFAQQDIVNNIVNPNNSVSAAVSSRHLYPPQPASVLPQYNNTATAETLGLDTAKGTPAAPWGSFQLGFLPRILVLIGLFGMSLGGLYLLAQVLPPLSLPKSIDDVKVDAEILQEFATATYEGWIRTFWVFSAVYMWKQCFGIPGSAFLNILAGALYGPWFGTVLTSALTTLGSVMAYFMSFFIMEPIMNRYASTRLDQMRAQIEKKTSRSSTKSSKATSFATSTATSTSSSLSTSPSTVSTGPTASIRGTLRTRSSSFTVRKTDGTDQDMSAIYSYPHQLVAANVLASTAVTPSHRDDIEIQESEGLLSEENNTEKVFSSNSNTLDIDGSKETDDGDEDQDEEEGTSLFMQLLLIRLFPLTPYWFINLASPLVGVPVIPFMTSMFLGCMPYNYICAQAGAILGEIHELRDIYQQPWIMFQIVMVLVLSGAAVWLSKRSKKQQMEKEQGGAKSRTSEEEMAEGDESTHSLLRQHRFVSARQDEEDIIVEESVPMSILDPHDCVPSRNSKRDSAIIDMSAYHY